MRQINRAKLGGIRRRPASVSTPPEHIPEAFGAVPLQSPPVVGTGTRYVLAFERVAFHAAIHQTGCACVPHPGPDQTALMATTWHGIREEPLPRRLLAFRWTIRCAPCARDLDTA